MSRTLLAVALVLFSVGAAQAWWCTGHMTVATIARQLVDSDVRSQIDNIISELSSMGPFPQTPNFVEAGCWADDLKRNIPEMKHWHFLNIPYNPTNFPIAHYPDQVENVAAEIAQFSDSIKWTKDGSNTWELTFALGNLIHFFGDIHQPLHVTEMFSSQFPNGDYGGNLFMIVTNGTSQDLHGYWDAICNQFVSDPKRPLSYSQLQSITDLANQYQSTYNISQEEINVWNASTMAQEGFNMAVQYAYANLQPGDTLSETYYNNCVAAAEYRVTLAGLRLGTQLNYLFKSYKKSIAAKHINEHIMNMHAEYTTQAAKLRHGLRKVKKH
jgi:hypothetical protein